uniref:Uncharacterized protein n=1 Tax=Arundo donax TaxID=35708 RepID=A0A0A9H4Q8_ARUDO
MLHIGDGDHEKQDAGLQIHQVSRPHYELWFL